MSNKTQLQTNNTALDGYIARINAAKEVAASLPEAGGGGNSNSGSLDTCTLNFSGTSLGGTGLYYFYQTVENGNVVLKYDNASTYTIEMVCGSYLVVICSSNTYDGQWSVSPGLTFSLTDILYGGNLKAYAVQANLSAGEMGTVTKLSGGYD